MRIIFLYCLVLIYSCKAGKKFKKDIIYNRHIDTVIDDKVLRQFKGWSFVPRNIYTIWITYDDTITQARLVHANYFYRNSTIKINLNLLIKNRKEIRATSSSKDSILLDELNKLLRYKKELNADEIIWQQKPNRLKIKNYQFDEVFYYDFKIQQWIAWVNV